ncbi:MAG: ParB/RepB/Spo0J family partition protein [Phycisphaerales bacterium]|nr:ParB/RepB/Spo0J family partition protein [Phycisphaerales bacterium]
MTNRTAESSQPSLRRRLGRGLGSLISGPVQVDMGAAVSVRAPASTSPPVVSQSTSVHEAIEPAGSDRLHMVRLDEITPNPRQPRKHFDDAALRSLANSIKASGLMQPVVVRRREKVGGGGGAGSGGYELVAGERRWRAARMAGLSTLPALVRELDDETSAEFSLVENLQREDLNPMERALAFQRLIDEFELTHAQIAERVGIDRTSVTNHLRLLELDEFIQEAIRGGGLSLGHAKVLLAVTNIERRASLADRAQRDRWSVRELERQVQAASPARPATGAAVKPSTPAHLIDLETRLGHHLGTKVQLRTGPAKGAGKLIVEFYSLDQFEGLLRRMQFDSDDLAEK